MQNSKKPFRLINPAGEHLTPDKLRTFKGFEHRPDSEVTGIIESLKTLAEILVRNCMKHGTLIDNQQVVYLNQSFRSIKKAA